MTDRPTPVSAAVAIAGTIGVNVIEYLADLGYVIVHPDDENGERLTAMTLTLTPDEADQLETGAVTLYRPGTADPATFSAMGGALVPPAEFAEAAKPCETCVKIMECGIAYDWPDHGCLDGKRRITAVTHCDHPSHENVKGGLWLCALSGPRHTNEGHVPVATVVVEWGPLPIEDGDRVSPPDYLSTNGYIIRSQPSHLAGMREHWADGPVTFPPGVDPATLVGQYALHIRKTDDPRVRAT